MSVGQQPADYSKFSRTVYGRHDDVRDIEDVSAALDRIMRDAAAAVLRGYELPTDRQIIRPGERYFDKRGAAMWETVTGLLTKREKETA